MINLFFILIASAFCLERDPVFLEPQDILISEKLFEGQKDRIFRDSLGREAYFRGWNFSNSSKNPPYFAFSDMNDLEHKLTMLRTYTGSNIIRWLVNWAAICPEVDVIDLAWLRKTTEAFRMAINMGFYILIDFHQDLFGPRGNGPPKWVIEGMNLKERKFCWPPFLCKQVENLKNQAWATSYFLDKETQDALRYFWNNKQIQTKEGRRYPQDEFIWAMKRALTYFRENLTPNEFKMIIGIDPWNEPAEGGLKKYNPPLTPAQWHEEKLWPFYVKIRETINSIGYKEKPLFAEPSTFWNIGLPLITARGRGFLKNIPQEGFVFNGHSYDEIREGLPILGKMLENGAYLHEMDEFRLEGRYLNMPPIVTEFGAWGSSKIYDSNRIIKATYQGMETTKTSKRTNPYLDFYAPLIHGTQWCFDGHAINISQGKWNDNVDYLVVERGYPRFVQGDIISFYYNDTASSSYDKTPLEWAGVRLMRKEYFSKNKFLWLVWRSNGSTAPTEIFIPRHFDLSNTLLITDENIVNDLNTLADKPSGESNEIFKIKDFPGLVPSGSRIFIYNDEKSIGFHFALIVEANLPSGEQKEFQDLLRKKVYLKESPIFLKGKVKIEKIKEANPHAK